MAYGSRGVVRNEPEPLASLARTVSGRKKAGGTRFPWSPFHPPGHLEVARSGVINTSCRPDGRMDLLEPYFVVPPSETSFAPSRAVAGALWRSATRALWRDGDQYPPFVTPRLDQE